MPGDNPASSKAAETFADRIRTLIAAVGSRRKLSRAVGVTDVAVMGWEHGVVPQERTLRDVAAKTGLSLQWLAHGTGDETQQIAQLLRSQEFQATAGSRTAHGLYRKSGSGRVQEVYNMEEGLGDDVDRQELLRELVALLPDASPRLKSWLGGQIAKLAGEMSDNILRD